MQPTGAQEEPGRAADAVARLLTAFEKLDLPGAVAAITPDAVYQPDPQAEPIRGREAIGALWASYFGKMHDYSLEQKTTASTEGSVFVERVETFTMGGRPYRVPVVGVFELRDGLVSAWRDYWDTSMLAQPA